MLAGTPYPLEAAGPPYISVAAPGGGGEEKCGSFFWGLLLQANQAHDLEVGLLQREVQRLRSELEARSPRGGSAGPGLDDECCSASGSSLQDGGSAGASFDDECCSGVQPEPPRQSSGLSTTPQRTPGAPGASAQTFRLGRGLTGTLSSQMEKKRAEDAKGLLYRIAHHPVTEIIIAVVIVVNGLVMAAEAQFEAYDLALRTRHPSASDSSDDVWASAPTFFLALNWVFGVFFTFEIIFTIAALRAAFAKDMWNWFDLFLVLSWWAGKGFQSLVNAQILRLARLVRLCRLLRLVKNMNSHFDSLYLMTSSLRGSISVLVWSFVMLLLLHFLLALLMNQLLRAVYFDVDDPKTAKSQAEVFTYFGSFTRAFLTMFEITLANWPTACRVLVEHVSEVFIIYAVLHKMILGFAVVGIVNGIFIQETFRVASVDNSVMVRQAMRRQKVHADKMRHLFNEADKNGDARVDRNEWLDICKDDWVLNWLQSQELHAKDALLLFEQLDDSHDGRLTADEMIQGTARLKGPAASMNMTTKINHIDTCLREINDELLANRAVAAENRAPPRV